MFDARKTFDIQHRPTYSYTYVLVMLCEMVLVNSNYPKQALNHMTSMCLRAHT